MTWRCRTQPDRTNDKVALLWCARVLLVTAQLHWGSAGFSTALPLLLQALALAQQHHLQALASETVLHLTFTQVRRTEAIFGVCVTSLLTL